MRTTMTVTLFLLAGVVLLAPPPCFASGESSRAEGPDSVADAEEVTAPSPSPELQIEVLLLEVKGGGVRELQAASSVKLTWEVDQLVLSEEQKQQLLPLIAEKDGMRLVARGDAKVPAGQEAVVELEGVLLYPLKHEPDTKVQAKTRAPKAAATAPSADKDKPPEAGNVTARIAVRPTLTGGSLGLVATVTTNARMKLEPEEGKKSFPQTTVSTSSKTTSVVLKDGSSVVVRQPLLKALFAAVAAAKESEMALSRQYVEADLAKLVKHANFPRTSLTVIHNFIERNAHIMVETDRSAWPILEAQAQTGTSSGGASLFPPLDISLNLHDVTLGDVLTEALRQKKLRYIIEVGRRRLLIVPEDYAPLQNLKTALFTFERGGRVWVSTDPQEPELWLQATSGGPDAARSLEPAMLECVREGLLDSGLSWPEGSAIKYNPDTGVMIVTNTPGNRRIVEGLVGVTTQLWLRPENQQCLLTIISARIVEPK